MMPLPHCTCHRGKRVAARITANDMAWAINLCTTDTLNWLWGYPSNGQALINLQLELPPGGRT